MPNSASSTFVVKVVQGTVSLYRSNGIFVRTLCRGAVAAVVQGDEVHVTNPDGRVRIYTTAGNYRRTI